ncbi:MAG: uridine kinase, partial [Lacisediminihabitans sp.]
GAVAGDSSSGAAGLADDLAATFRDGGRKAFRASLENFHRSRAERGEETAAAYYDGAYDYSLFRRVLVDPFRSAGSTGFVLSGYDEARDTAVQPKWQSAGADAILIVDGQFLNRPELAGLWNYSIWTVGSVDTGGESGSDTVASQADELYLRQVAPRARATGIVDYRDPEHPRRQFADSC